MRFEIEKDFQFEAAHYFGHADANDVFKKIHGHSLGRPSCGERARVRA